MTIGIVIPAFNEQATIERLVSGLPHLVLGRAVTPVVVDDGSTDETRAIVERLGITMLVVPVNRGKAAALRQGIELLRTRADLEAVVWMDADGQHRPSDVEPLVRPILSGSVDLVIGSRNLTSRGRGATPRNRWLVTRATVAVLRGWYGCSVTDPYSGFRAFSRRALDRIELVGERYECELDALLSVAAAGMPIAEVPIPKLYGTTSSMELGSLPGVGRMRVVVGYIRVLVRHRRERTTGGDPVELVSG